MVILVNASCTTKRNNFVILIDNSKSITEALLDGYISMIQSAVMDNMRIDDRMTISFIDECSLSKAERIFTVDFSKMKFTNPLDGKMNEEDSIKARFNRVLNDSIKPALRTALLAKRAERRNECGNYTDIINAIKETKSLITSEKNFSTEFDKINNEAGGEESFKYENFLIVFSDMINEDRNKLCDFTTMGKLSAAQVNEKLNQLEIDNKIPNLKDVNVLVHGATSSKEAGRFQNEQIANIRLFWEQYFEKSGAKLKAYGYDTENEFRSILTSN